MSHSGWQSTLFTPAILQIRTTQIIDILKEDNILAIAVCGMSGAIIGGAISFMSGIPLILIRKEDDECHSAYKIAYHDGKLHNEMPIAIIDDLIQSGATMNHMIAHLNNAGFNNIQEIILYHRKRDEAWKGIPIKFVEREICQSH